MTDTPELIAAIEELLDQHSFKIAVEMELHAALGTTTKNKAKDIRLSLSDLACLISVTQAAEIERLQKRVAELEADIRQSKCEAVSYLGQLYDAQGRALAAEARVAELEAVASAAHGLSFGEDWNKGNHAVRHGYRRKLLVALAEAFGDVASPQARAALREKPE